MGALTPTFTVKFEDRLRSIMENEYSRLTSNLWWQNVARVLPSMSKRDYITWLLSTSTIKDQGDGGNIAFDDIVANSTIVENKWSGVGLKLRRDQLTDVYNGVVGGEAMDFGGKWAADTGMQMAYWPQKQTARFLMNAHLAASAGGFDAYDALPFFSGSHPLNPFDAAAGTFANLHKTSGGSVGLGALPIDDSVSLETAINNLAKLYAYVASIKQASGEDPRFLRPKTILVSPRLFPRAVQLTQAKFFGQVVGSYAATADVEALIGAMGYGMPMQADELAGFESDTTYFVVFEQAASSQLGGVIYVEREPFAVNYYDGMTQAELNRKQELEWHCLGRNAIAAGHPYLITKVKGV